MTMAARVSELTSGNDNFTGGFAASDGIEACLNHMRRTKIWGSSRSGGSPNGSWLGQRLARSRETTSQETYYQCVVPEPSRKYRLSSSFSPSADGE